MINCKVEVDVSNELKFVEIPSKLLPFVGEPDEGTRLYRAEGSDIECERWFDALNEHIPGGFVSPGGVYMFANVSRAAVYERIKRGRLTAFLFYIMRMERRSMSLLDRLDRRTPLMYVPVNECRAWGKMIEERSEEREEAARDDNNERNFDGSYFQLQRRKKRKGK